MQQKQHHKNITGQILAEVANDTELLKCGISGDEPWVYSYDTKTKAQSSQRQLPEKPKEAF